MAKPATAFAAPARDATPGPTRDALKLRGVLGAGYASEIVANLYLGGYPKYPKKLKSDGVDVLVLSAKQFQAADSEFPGVEVIRAPIVGGPTGVKYLGPSPEQTKIAVDAANRVIQALLDGKVVLVTCWLGRHRSALITALVLMGLYGVSGKSAIDRIKKQRPMALSSTTSPGLVAFLEKLPPQVGK